MAATRVIWSGVVCAIVPARSIVWFHSVTSSARAVAVKILAKTATKSSALVILFISVSFHFDQNAIYMALEIRYFDFGATLAYQEGPQLNSRGLLHRRVLD